MNRLKLKQHVISLLLSKDLDTIFSEFSSIPEKKLLNALFSCLCHPQEMVRWHAVSSFGYVVPAIAVDDMEEARIIMRRFLWMLNDESGGIGWGVPEAMAEVMYHSRPLKREYLHMLVSYTLDDGPAMFQDGNFLELDMLQEGVMWGLCRVAPICKDELLRLGLDKNIDVYLRSKNSCVKGLACRLAGFLELKKHSSTVAFALEDLRPVRVYHEGQFYESTVAELAAVAMNSF
ncbi:MAG: DVU0298 family protein [Desulfocapsaceae bacterium]